MPTAEDDVLPRAPESERYIAGCLLAFPHKAAEVMSRVQPSDFLDPALATVVGVLLRQHAAGGVDMKLASAALKSNPLFDGNPGGFMLELAYDVATAAHVPHEAERIVEARRKRQRLERFEQWAEAARNNMPSRTSTAILSPRSTIGSGKRKPRSRATNVQPAICRKNSPVCMSQSSTASGAAVKPSTSLAIPSTAKAGSYNTFCFAS
jgi:hypothetical protein